MPEPQDLGPPERELAEALGGLMPAAPRPATARDIWYQAGYAAARRRGNRWRAAAGVAALVACVMGVWRPRRAPVTVERVVYVRPETPTRPSAVVVAHEITSPAPGPSSTAYLRLRDEIARDGLSVWPTAPAGDGGVVPGRHRGPIGPAGDPAFTPGWDLPNERG
jgi:hypothetical protein